MICGLVLVMKQYTDNTVAYTFRSLTVRSGQAGSHANKGWETFTDAVIDVVDKYGGTSLSLLGALYFSV